MQPSDEDWSSEALPPVAPPLAASFLRAAAVGSIVGALLAALSVVEVATQVEQARAGAHARSMAGVAAALVKGDTLREAMRKAPGKDAFLDWGTAPAPLREMHAELAQLTTIAALGGEVSVLHLRDAGRGAVRDQPGQSHHGALELTVSSAGTPRWRALQPYEPGMAAAFFDSTPSVSGRLTDERGDHVAGYVPILDADHGVVAVARASVALPSRSAVLVDGGPLLWVSLLAILGIGPLAVWLVAGRVVARLHPVAVAARARARGDDPEPIPDAPYAEVEALTDGLTAVQRRLDQQIAAHQAERAALTDRLSAATEPTPAQRRRTRFDALSGELEVALRLCDQTRSTRLVDFWDGAVVVAMRPERVPDVAPGMALGVAVGMDGRTTVVVPCVYQRRETVGPLVELHLRVDGPVEPSGFPPALAAMLDQRKTPRVRPGERARVLVAVFAPTVGKPVNASLVDISTSGARVVIPVSHPAVSTWGTRIEVALKLYKERPPVRFGAHIRSARPHADGLTVLGVELDVLGTDDFEGQVGLLEHWIQQVAER